MTHRISEECHSSNVQVEQVIERFHIGIGWDTHTNNLRASALLSAGTWEQVLTATTESLDAFDIPNAREKVEYWHTHLGDIHANDKPLIPDLPGFMSYFKQMGIIVAICTSDDRKATDACVRNWGLDGLIDYSICGDEVLESKPSAQPLLSLCKQAQVSPQECIIVGDTSADTGMGRNSNAGLIIGVLSGSGTADHLFEKGAHVVLPDISYLIGFASMFPSISSRPTDDEMSMDNAQLLSSA